MALIPESVIEQVLARTDIHQTIQEYVNLKKSGSSYKGLCPFHSEKTPSFYVHPDKGFYKCFGCSAGGNVISFLMDLEGWNFPETVRHLAERHGIEIPEETSEEAEQARRKREGKKLYLKIMTQAREYFETMLWSEEGRAAQLYLEERNIDVQTAKSFGLGYAPQGWQNLLDHMEAQDFPAAYLERAGLATRKDRGGHYDRFRHRVIFPVVDIWGNTLAFGGRTLATNKEEPKYINSPETAYYTKGLQLYGLDVAKKEMQKSEFALLVEGNFDVISLHNHGFTMTVAPMGTALTADQARLLARYAKRVIIAFDGDSAGQEATLRCLPALEKAGIEAQVIQFDEYDDPDTFVRRYGAQALQDKLSSAKALVAWALDGILTPVEGGQIEAKLQALKQAGALLGEVQNAVAWEHYAQETSRRLAIEPKLLKDYLKRPQANEEKTRQAVMASQMGAELESAEYGVLVVLLDQPQWLEDFFRDELDKLLCSQELADFLSLTWQNFQGKSEINGPLLLERISHSPLRKTVENALADAGLLYQPEKRLRWYQDCVRTLKRSWANRTLEFIMAELERTDFRSQRETFEQLNHQMEQVNRFKAALDAPVDALH